MWYLFEYENWSYSIRDLIAKTVYCEWGKLYKWNGNVFTLTAFFTKIDKQHNISISRTCFLARQFSRNAGNVRLVPSQDSRGGRRHHLQPHMALDWTKCELCAHPEIADAVVTAISHWSQMQDLCMDLSLVAFSEFYFYFKSVLTGMKRFTKKVCP